MTLFRAKSHYLFSLFLTILFIDVAIATPARESQTQSHSLERRLFSDNDQSNCETARSGDYYGFGVRLGIYLAWFQAWIANTCVPSEISLALDTNTIFLFAVVVSMVRCTISGLLLQMDGLILMHIGGGTIFSVLSIWGYRTCTFDTEGPSEGIQNFGGWGTHFRLLLCFAISTYGLYFWRWGIIGHLDPNTDPGCKVVYTWFFSKLRADGGIRILYIVICSGCMLYFGSMIIASLVALPDRVQRFIRSQKEGDTGDRLRHRFATGLTLKQLRYVFYFLRISNLIFIFYSIVLIEFSLDYNDVGAVLGWSDHVGFPSQIIPWVIGTFGFIRVIWVRYCKWKSPDYLHSRYQRSLLKPDLHEITKIYTAKSDMGFTKANNLDENMIDPLMEHTPLYLRLLVSWLPWLGVLRWWKPDHDSSYRMSADRDPEANGLMAIALKNNWNSSESTPEFGSPMLGSTWASDFGSPRRAGTWGGDNTVANVDGRMNAPAMPTATNLARFGSLFNGRRSTRRSAREASLLAQGGDSRSGSPRGRQTSRTY